MALSCINKTSEIATFDYLYYNYGTRAKMYEIYKRMKKVDVIPDYIDKIKDLAPAEREDGFGGGLLG
jgi:hypothetical protein